MAMSLSVGILIPTMGWRVKPCWNKMFWLVVDLPLWKIWKSVGMMTFPTIGENKTCFKPPTSVCFIFQGFQNCFAGIKQRNQRISKEHRCAWMVKPWLLLVILLIETYCLCFHSTMCCRVVESMQRGVLQLQRQTIRFVRLYSNIWCRKQNWSTLVNRPNAGRQAVFFPREGSIGFFWLKCALLSLWRSSCLTHHVCIPYSWHTKTKSVASSCKQKTTWTILHQLTSFKEAKVAKHPNTQGLPIGHIVSCLVDALQGARSQCTLLFTPK